MTANDLGLRPGRVVAKKYRIERKLGEGGMGVVLAARHLALNRSVALKFLRPEVLGDEENVERFLREARAMAQLTSEHCVRVLDVDRLEDGVPYVVMELLEGASLEQALTDRGRPFTVEQAVDFVLQACEAIGEAHALSIVHRDLKLGNLFLTKRADKAPLVKVLDFGLGKVLDPTVAKALGSGATGFEELTLAGAAMGSPAYMSPEQLVSTRDVDERADIWSLGVCLYELVTGRVPFAAPSLTLLMARIREHEATPATRAREDVPAELSDAIARCLEKDPARRFQTVTELAQAIEPHAPSATVRAREVMLAFSRTRPAVAEQSSAAFDERTTAPQESEPGRARRRRGIQVAAVAACIAVGVAAAFVFARPRAPDARVPAAAPASAALEAPSATTEPSIPPPAPAASAAPSEVPSATASEAPASSHPARGSGYSRALPGRPVTHPGSDRF